METGRIELPSCIVNIIPSFTCFITVYRLVIRLSNLYTFRKVELSFPIQVGSLSRHQSLYITLITPTKIISMLSRVTYFYAAIFIGVSPIIIRKAFILANLAIPVHAAITFNLPVESDHAHF